MPKKRCPRSWDLLDPFLVPPDLRPPKKPRFSGILDGTPGSEDDHRTPLMRYADYLIGVSQRPGYTQLAWLTQLANSFKALVGHYEQLIWLRVQRQQRLAQGQSAAEVEAWFRPRSNATLATMGEHLPVALTSLRKGIANLREDLPIILEIPYLILRGNKKTLIELCRHGRYTEWSTKYPHLWRIDGGENANDWADNDPDDAFPQWWGQGKHRAPRPCWWEAMQPGPFTRTIRHLAPRTKLEKAKIFHSPAFLWWCLQNGKKPRDIDPFDALRAG